MRDSWQSGDAYEYFMGRWSRLVARSFLKWLSPESGLRWLDVGCGSGALSEAIVKDYAPAELTAIDQSQGFVDMAQRRLRGLASRRVGDALALPLDDSTVDVTVSGLVLNFIPEQARALAEMMRVTAPGGTVATYVWDYAGQMDFLRIFWDTVVELNPDASSLHEASRFADSSAEVLRDSFQRAGFEEIDTAPMDIVTEFRDFEDYWEPFLGGQGPAPTYLLSLGDTERDELRSLLYNRLPIQADGSIPMTARAWAVKGMPYSRKSLQC